MIVKKCDAAEDGMGKAQVVFYDYTLPETILPLDGAIGIIPDDW